MRYLILQPVAAHFRPVLRRNLSVLFYGSDNFSKACLKSLHCDFLSDKKVKVVTDLGVVCLPEKQHKLPVKVYADKNKIPCATWPGFPECECTYDIGVVVSFGKLIPKSVIRSFKYGMINVHGSLLPRWRGASPFAHAIMAADEETGVTIMEIKPGRFDHGGVLKWSEAIAIKPNWTAEDLGITLEDVASDCLLECLGNIEHYMSIKKQQNKDEVTYAPKITHDDTQISWSTQTAEKIYRQYLAYGFKKELNLRTTFENNVIKLQRIELPSDEQLSRLPFNTEPGDVVFEKKSRTIFVKCRDGYVGITKLINKKPMMAQDFYNGSMQVSIKSGKKIKFS